MKRLLLALLLALGLHLLLFRMMIPVRETQSPVVSGRGRVTVTLARPAVPVPVLAKAAEQPPQSGPVAPEPPLEPEPEKPEPVPEPVPGPVPEPEPVAERKLSVAAAPRPSPAAKKIETPVRMERVGNPAPDAPSAAGGATSAFPSGEENAPAAAGAESVAAALRQAVPLAADNRPPEYPALARKRGWEGKVMLAVAVAGDGTVQGVRVQSGSGHDLLDAAALRAVRQWRFQPGTRAGAPVAMEVLVPVHFLLKDNS